MEDLKAISANRTLKNYEILHTIGEGEFAKVKLARHAVTQQVVAIKVIHVTNGTWLSIKKMFREIGSMRSVSHPNIVKLQEVIVTEGTVFLVMDFARGGDLRTYVSAKGRLTEREARGFFRQLVSALQHCHQQGVVHRNLKLGNVLLDDDNNVKIADFGLSSQWHPGRKLDTICGSPVCMAPELFLSKPYTGPEVDVWSLGVVLYHAVTGSLPFTGRDFWEVGQSVLRGRYHMPTYLSPEIGDLIDRMLTVSPTTRATLDDVRQHAWMTMGQEEPLPPPCDEDPGVTADMILGRGRALIHGLDKSSVSDVNEPKVGVRIIKVRPAVSSDLRSQEQTSKPATPPPCAESRPVTPSPGPSTRNTREASSARASDHAGDPATRGTSLPGGTCGRRDSSHGRDPSLTRDPTDACDPRSAGDTGLPRGPSLPGNARSARDTGLPRDALTARGTRGDDEVPAGAPGPPDAPGAGSPTRAGQPQSTAPGTPSGLTQNKKGVAGRIWRCLCRCLCCGRPSKRANKVKPASG